MVVDLQIDPEEWHSQSVRWGHPVHSMCSYMASFPPRVPHYFINRFTKKGDIVLDPFCGRGTTPAEACLMGRVGIGNDLNPIAYVLTKAKVMPPKKYNVISRVNYLKSRFRYRNTSSIPDKIKMLYNIKTQQQLLYLKDKLDIENSIVDNFIMALILGGMHGDSGKPSYMSIPMPNTFSMSPNYVKKYIREHKLKPPKHDAFDVINHRLKRCRIDKINSIKGKVYINDIRNIPKLLRRTKVDMIFTSPPYLKVIKYGKLNWIRLWMLEEEPNELDKTLDDKHTVPKYMEFIKDTINILAQVMNNDALCFFVVGQVSGNRGPGKGRKMRLGNQIRFRLKNKVDLEFIDLIDDKYNKYLRVRKNVSRIWGETEGKATKYDQILVLCKDKNKIKNKKYNKNVNWDRNY